MKPDNDDAEGFKAHSLPGDDWKACRDHVRQKLGLPAFAPKKNGGGMAAPASLAALREHIYRDEKRALSC